MDRRYLTDPVRPIPVGENVSHRVIGPPTGLVKVESIFREAAEVEDPKIRAARRRTGPSVSRGLAEEAETCPAELPGNKRIPVLCFELHVTHHGPGRSIPN